MEKKNITSLLSAPFSSVSMFRLEYHTEGCLCCQIKRLVSLQPGCAIFFSASLSVPFPHAHPQSAQDSTLNVTDCQGCGRARAYCNLCFFFWTEQHFPEVMLGEEFLSLSLDQVCSLISSDKLTVSSEEKVWHDPSVNQDPHAWGGHGRDSETFSLSQQEKKGTYFLALKIIRKGPSGSCSLHLLFGHFEEGITLVIIMVTKLPPFTGHL